MRRVFWVAVFVLFSAAAAHGQVAIYVTSANTHISNVASGTANSLSGTVTLHQTYWDSGIGGGVTLNFLPLPVVSLGIDLRGSTKSGANGADTALVGLKLGVHPPVIPIKPYIQGSVGYLAARPQASPVITNKYLAYEVLGGVDYPLIKILDWRVIEIGGGGVINSSSSNSPNLFTINTGLVLHF